MADSPRQQSAAKGWHEDLGAGTDWAGADCTCPRVSLSASPPVIKSDKEKARKKMLSRSIEKVYSGLMSAAHLECWLLHLNTRVGVTKSGRNLFKEWSSGTSNFP